MAGVSVGGGVAVAGLVLIGGVVELGVGLHLDGVGSCDLISADHLVVVIIHIIHASLHLLKGDV